MGNLDSLRDWGHARDYVEMQWLMLQQEQPNFVIATGRQESVRRFISSRLSNWPGVRCNGMVKAPLKWAAAAYRCCGGAHRSALFPPCGG